MFFLRKAKLDTEPLALKMSGIRMGERLLQLGADDPALLSALALKIGLSGTTAVAVATEVEAQRARDAAAGAGALIDLQVAPYHTLPFGSGAFDAVVVHGTGGLLRALRGSGDEANTLREARRVLRHGGRILVIEAGPKSGLSGLIRPYRPDAAYEAAGGAVAALESAGFRPVRLLSERDGYRFIEGLNT